MFKGAYPDAAEEIDSKVPVAKIDELEITAFIDSDHAHDKMTRRSITGLLILVGRTPVYFMSKRQRGYYHKYLRSRVLRDED